MKRLLYIVPFIVCFIIGWGLYQPPLDKVAEAKTNPYILGSSAVTAEDCAYNYCEGFEGVGIPSNWTNTNLAEYDYSSSGLDMVGSKVMRMVNNADTYYTIQTQGDETFVSFKLRRDTNNTTATDDHVAFRDSSDNLLCHMLIEGDGDIKVKGYDVLTSSKIIVTWGADDSKYFYLRYKLGTGANAECEGGYWTGAAWANEYASNGGSRTVQAARIRFWNENESAPLEIAFFDEIKVHTSSITDPE